MYLKKCSVVLFVSHKCASNVNYLSFFIFEMTVITRLFIFDLTFVFKWLSWQSELRIKWIMNLFL